MLLIVRQPTTTRISCDLTFARPFTRILTWHPLNQLRLHPVAGLCRGPPRTGRGAGPAWHLYTASRRASVFLPGRQVCVVWLVSHSISFYPIFFSLARYVDISVRARSFMSSVSLSHLLPLTLSWISSIALGSFSICLSLSCCLQANGYAAPRTIFPRSHPPIFPHPLSHRHFLYLP